MTSTVEFKYDGKPVRVEKARVVTGERDGDKNFPILCGYETGILTATGLWYQTKHEAPIFRRYELSKITPV